MAAGSRLEGITKQYGADILIGQETKERINGIVLREIDLVQVKGKDEPITIYQPLGLEGEVEQAVLDEIKLWNQALRYYRAQEWDKAEMQLLNLQKIAQRYLYEVFIERVAAYCANPPEPHGRRAQVRHWARPRCRFLRDGPPCFMSSRARIRPESGRQHDHRWGQRTESVQYILFN
jgi:hypothetical protein